MAATMSMEELDSVSRHAFWIKARQDKHGKYKDPIVEEAVKKIMEVEKQQIEGIFIPEGTHDVLTEGLGNPEHSGRVRGVGAVKLEAFFKLPVAKRGRKKKEEELAEAIAKDRAIFMEEMNKKHEEEIRMLHKSYEEKLKQSEDNMSAKVAEMIDAKIGNSEMRNGENFTPTNGASVGLFAKSGSERCNRGDDGGVVLGNYAAVQKKLLLETHTSSHEYENCEGRLNIASMGKAHSQEENLFGNSQVSLALDTIDNIVAYGKVIEEYGEVEKQTIHGIPLGKDNIRVEILDPVVGMAKLPFPIKDEMVLVIEAVGSIVAWPKNLCVMAGVKDSVPSGKADQEPSDAHEEMHQKNKKMLQSISIVEDKEEDLDNLLANLPRQLCKLCKWANDYLRNDKTINPTFGPELFGASSMAVIFRSDIYAMIHLQEVTASTIVFYMSRLFKVLKKKNKHESIIFVDPKETYAIGTQRTPTDRSRSLFERFKKGKNDSIFLAPYNVGGHWTLTVVDVNNKKAYWLDPLKNRLATEWTEVVNNGIKFYYAHKEPKRKTNITVKWMNLHGVPKQYDGKVCGFYIMRFMRDIAFGNDVAFQEKWERKSGDSKYSKDEIDEVRKEWAEEVMSFKV